MESKGDNLKPRKASGLMNTHFPVLPSPESAGHGFLCLGIELGASTGQVEHVNGALPFRVNQGDFDIAALISKNRADVKEQAGPVLGDKFEKGAVRRALAVKPHAGGHLDFGLRRGYRLSPATQELFQFQCPLENIDKVLLEAITFRRIQLEGAVQID